MHLVHTNSERAPLNAKNAQPVTIVRKVASNLLNAKTVIVPLAPLNPLSVKMVPMVTKRSKSLRQLMIALFVLTHTTVTVVSFKVFATLAISVILELHLGKMKTRSALKVTTAPLVLYSLLDAQKPSTGLVLEPEMSHTAHLVRLVTTALITIVFHVFVQEVTSVLKRPKSPSHAGREHITLISALRKPLTVVLAQQALLVIREVLINTNATCVQQDTTVQR